MKFKQIGLLWTILCLSILCSLSVLALTEYQGWGPTDNATDEVFEAKALGESRLPGDSRVVIEDNYDYPNQGEYWWPYQRIGEEQGRYPRFVGGTHSPDADTHSYPYFDKGSVTDDLISGAPYKGLRRGYGIVLAAVVEDPEYRADRAQKMIDWWTRRTSTAYKNHFYNNYNQANLLDSPYQLSDWDKSVILNAVNTPYEALRLTQDNRLRFFLRRYLAMDSGHQVNLEASTGEGSLYRVLRAEAQAQRYFDIYGNPYTREGDISLLEQSSIERGLTAPLRPSKLKSVIDNTERVLRDYEFREAEREYRALHGYPIINSYNVVQTSLEDDEINYPRIYAYEKSFRREIATDDAEKYFELAGVKREALNAYDVSQESASISRYYVDPVVWEQFYAGVTMSGTPDGAGYLA